LRCSSIALYYDIAIDTLEIFTTKDSKANESRKMLIIMLAVEICERLLCLFKAVSERL